MTKKRSKKKPSGAKKHNVRRNRPRSLARSEQPPKVIELLKEATSAKDTRQIKALKAWRRLSRKSQWALASTVAEARERELRLAYPCLVAVGHGFRTTNKGQRETTREPCVVFMVEKKRRRVAAVKRLPTLLYAYWGGTGDNKGILCAVPTDIECGSEYNIQLHGLTEQVCISKAPLETQKGVITSAVVNSHKHVFALSCHHVLGMSLVTSPVGRPATGAIVARCGSEGFGELAQWGGKLVPSTQGLSFDAALARVKNHKISDLLAAIGNRLPKEPQDDAIPLFSVVRTPRDDIRLELVEVWTNFDRINYLPSHLQPVQAEIVEWAVIGGITLPGDSGAPIVKSDGTLLGMYIAGTDEGDKAFMIPAKFLLMGFNYHDYGNPSRVLPGRLRLLTP